MKSIIKWHAIILALIFLSSAELIAAGVGDRMPTFEITTLDGTVLKSEDIIGQKPLFLVFWATWCPNCKREIPHINKMVKEFGPKGMEFLGVNVGVNDSEKKVRRYTEKYGMHYPVFFDQGSNLTKRFKVSGTPTVIIVDKSGTVRYRDVSPPEDLGNHFAGLNK